MAKNKDYEADMFEIPDEMFPKIELPQFELPRFEMIHYEMLDVENLLEYELENVLNN